MLLLLGPLLNLLTFGLLELETPRLSLLQSPKSPGQHLSHPLSGERLAAFVADATNSHDAFKLAF